jgi:hypothetical protein
MRVSAECLEELAERRPKQLIVRLDGKWRPIVRVSPGIGGKDNRTVYVSGYGYQLAEDREFDVRLRVDG